jgi:hypothetical protein
MRAVWVILAAFAILSLPVLADPPMTKLRIEVKTLSGQPVERAGVIVRFVQGRSIVKFGKKIRTNWETRTNMEGVAKIPPIPQGTILIQVSAAGYQTFGKPFEVAEAEKTIEIKLNPPQPQYSVHE